MPQAPMYCPVLYACGVCSTELLSLSTAVIYRNQLVLPARENLFTDWTGWENGSSVAISLTIDYCPSRYLGRDIPADPLFFLPRS
jgi:hypothetical protein